MNIHTEPVESQTQYTAKFLMYTQALISYELLRETDPRRARDFMQTVPVEFQRTTAEMLVDFLAQIARWVEMLGSWEAFRQFSKEAVKGIKLRLIKEWSPQTLPFILTQHVQKVEHGARRRTNANPGGGHERPPAGRAGPMPLVQHQGWVQDGRQVLRQALVLQVRQGRPRQGGLLQGGQVGSISGGE